MARRRVVVGIVALAVAAFAGGAYAATQSSTNWRQAFLDDVAKRLNVAPAQLDSAIKGAFLDRLNAAVKAGTLTQAQANQIEQRLQQTGTIPFFGLRGLGRFSGPRALGGFFAPRGLSRHMRVGRGGALAAAASYLGLTRAQLMKDLESGQTFAQIAKAQGKTLQGLESSVLAAFKSRLDSAVAAGRITKAQEQQLLNRLSARINRRFNGALGPHRAGPPPGALFAPAAPPPPGGPGASVPPGRPGAPPPPGGPTASPPAGALFAPSAPPPPGPPPAA